MPLCCHLCVGGDLNTTIQLEYTDNPVVSCPKAYPEGKYWNYGYNINLSQSIFNYSSWAALAGAKNVVKAAEATYNAAAQSLISRTIQAYTQVLSDYETLQTQQAQSNYLYQNLRSQRKNPWITCNMRRLRRAITDLTIATEISDQNTLSI